MPRAFSTIAFTPGVQAVQERYGSREQYRGFDAASDEYDELSEREAHFMANIDTFFMSTVNADGWPYVQHRGGPKGFLKMLDSRTLGFADYAGNRQYISTGNVMHNDRVMLILMDFARRRRLKIWGYARIIHEQDEPALFARLHVPSYPARAERGYVIRVQALDYNCPQHIQARYTMQEFAAMQRAAGNGT